MKIKRFLLTLTLAILCLRAAADAPAVPQYAIADLGPLHIPEYDNVDRGAFALNDAGQTVGGDGHAFLWSNGKRTELSKFPAGIPDSDPSIAYAINASGQIVGSFGTYAYSLSGELVDADTFLYHSGHIRPLLPPPSGGGFRESFEAYAINDKGQIVGLDGYRGFLYQNGQLIQLGTLSSVSDGNSSTARAVSNSGQIVGWSTVNKGMFGPPYWESGRFYIKRHGKRILTRLRVPTHTYFTHACLWRASGKAVRQRDLGTLPGWVNSYAYGINDRGEVVGSVSNATGGTDGVFPKTHAQAFLWRNSKMTGLGTLPGCRSSEAFGINNAGAVVGQSDNRAFLWQSGQMRDLNALLPAGAGWTLTEARAINTTGTIVGSGTLHGESHAFLLSPR